MIDSFDEVRLPARLAFGSTGGVERRTEVVQLASGYERRSTPWAFGRRRYLIGAGLRSLDDMATLTAFFEARQGRLRGFRFKDFADFKSGLPSQAVTAGDQEIGLGDGVRTRFQLRKAYGAAWREITKPVAETVRVAVNGVEVLQRKTGAGAMMAVWWARRFCAFSICRLCRVPKRMAGRWWRWRRTRGGRWRFMAGRMRTA